MVIIFFSKINGFIDDSIFWFNSYCNVIDLDEVLFKKIFFTTWKANIIFYFTKLITSANIVMLRKNLLNDIN